MNKDIGAEMNEKIRELMLAAGYAAPDLASRGQKLAELIVQECIDNVGRRFVGDHNREDAEVQRCVADLKQHFGVEE